MAVRRCVSDGDRFGTSSFKVMSAKPGATFNVRLNLKATRERDRANSSHHEAGHFIVATHFGLECFCWVEDKGFPTSNLRSFIGGCRHEKTTPFRSAVLGWAGRIGGSANGKNLNVWREELLDVSYYCDEDFSATDLQYINRHPWKARAYKTAAGIIERRFSSFKAIAAHLIDHRCYFLRR
jgi:hypothetical protein